LAAARGCDEALLQLASRLAAGLAVAPDCREKAEEPTWRA
jgi:hypothetical protein